MKYATAIHNIKRRGQEDIAPKQTFEIAELDEFRRLEGLNAAREATAEEIKLYQASKQSGDIAARKVEGSKVGLDNGDGDNTKTAAKNGAKTAAKVNTAPAEGGDTSKVAENKTSSTSTASTKAGDDDI